jgi:hypothetical protein
MTSQTLLRFYLNAGPSTCPCKGKYIVFDCNVYALKEFIIDLHEEHLEHTMGYLVLKTRILAISS